MSHPRTPIIHVEEIGLESDTANSAGFTPTEMNILHLNMLAYKPKLTLEPKHLLAPVHISASRVSR